MELEKTTNDGKIKIFEKQESTDFGLPNVIEKTIDVKQNNSLITLNDDIDTVYNKLNLLIEGKWLPDHIKSPETAYSIAIMGKELGFEIMQSFHYIIPISGRLSLASKAIGALLKKSNVFFNVIRYAQYMYNKEGVIEFSEFPLYSTKSEEHSKFYMGRITTIEGRRHIKNIFGEIETITHKTSYTTIDATNAGLIDKDNWKRMLPDMLFARCLSRFSNIIAPDALCGLPMDVDLEPTLDIPYQNL